MRTTYHLTPAERWFAADPAVAYDAPSLATEGFIHCTDGEAALLATGDRHHRDDPRTFMALSVDLDRVGSPWRVEDPAGIYPHIFGPIDRRAILTVGRVRRAADGRFIGIDPDGEPAPADGDHDAGDPVRPR